MCTAIKYKTCFGRTLDYDKRFGEELVRVEKGILLNFVHEGTRRTEYSIIGAARMVNGRPLFFDGMNDAGLCAAALNFPNIAFYRGERCGEVNIASFELISYILSSCKSVEEVRYKLRNLNITSESASADIPHAPLHWMVADMRESLVIEPLKDGVKMLEDPAEVLTNAPCLEYQLTRLADFMQLDSRPPQNNLKNELDLPPYSRGMGAIGLPGDWSSTSRFVRAVFVKEKLDARNMSDTEALFEILNGVSVPYGCVITENGESVGTQYTSCMDMRSGIYRYRKSGDIKEKTLEFI
jgi:choloylglycine hydrolase